jgi:hypothetical protein
MWISFLFSIFVEIYNSIPNKEQYERIVFCNERNKNYGYAYPHLIGIRAETKEELVKRIKEEVRFAKKVEAKKQARWLATKPADDEAKNNDSEQAKQADQAEQAKK